MNKYKKYFSKFLTMNEGKTHFACHSHHYWPDCTREAQLQYWDDSSKYVDDKWELIFSKKIPKVQQLISNILDFDRPKDICFAPNTHELVYRVLSSYQNKIKILTTDSEFYSFSRQLRRLIELNLVEVKIVETSQIETFEERFLKESRNGYDVIFLSQVFFNSGLALIDFTNFVEKLTQSNSQVIIDGYHAFMAIPTSLKNISDRIFYIAGSYKYAAGGEGCCFMTIPKNCTLTPRNTGWFAEVENLQNVNPNLVPFSNDGLRFAGSTFDFSALYRLKSVLELYEQDGITVNDIHKHVQECQNGFISAMNTHNHLLINSKTLISRGINNHGHFLTFDLPHSDDVKSISKILNSKGIQTDSRETRLRFGFSIYHDIDFDYSKIFKD